ncbi:gliding motility-associated C-terminal domain-containing protein [Spirosoma sp. SC4-14]|uniref:T9SS type B sorting domain-containing protein n=1 Tax=Spirosoma sp. SC4-14 TaxID=3128900 RepID=UPI0030D0E1A6
MKARAAILLTVVLVLVAGTGSAQNLTGFWLGIASSDNSADAPVSYAMSITQTGTSIRGITQTAAIGTSFGETAALSGDLMAASITFGETSQNGALKTTCFWKGNLSYHSTTESLTGTYESISNGSACTQQHKGTIELYRITLQPDSVFCKDSPVNATVTGKNIRWYTTAFRSNLLATGNTFTPQISQTTTFYITQTLNQIESPAIPITIRIEAPSFKINTIPAGCGRTSGSITVVGAHAANWQYNLNNNILQADSTFAGLIPGNYVVSIRTAAGCHAEQPVTLTFEEGPTVSNVTVTPPHCASANGQVVVEASGGKSPLMYSIDYGNTFQTNPVFEHLSAQAYTVRTRDANGCEVNKAVSLPAPNLMNITNLSVLPTTCGQNNGQFTITIGGIQPIQYSIDNQHFQNSNVFTDLKADNYLLTAKDGGGCTLTQPIRIAPSSGPQVATTEIEPEACGQRNGVVHLTLKPPADSIYLSIDGVTFGPATMFSGLEAGSYTIYIKDSHACLVSELVQVPSNCPNLLSLPTAFSPNADRQNDELRVFFRFTSILVMQFTVYDRWGTVIYNRANFVLANGESVWDGYLSGSLAPAGIYLYRLSCEFPDGTQTTIRQPVSLLR